MLKGFLLRLLPRNAFVRRVSLLIGGTAASQLLVVASSPLLTRLYDPHDFGVLAVFAAVLMIFSGVSSLRYHLAIPLPESRAEAWAITLLSVFVCFALAALLGLLVLFFDDELVRIGSLEIEPNYLLLVPVGVFAIGVYQAFIYWSFREKEFTAVARTRFTQSLVMVLAQTGGYVLGPIALITGHILGQSAGALRLGAIALKKRDTELASGTRLRKIWLGARRYWRFPAYSTWSALASAGGSQLPPLLIALLFGMASSGTYMLTQRVLTVPMTLVGKAVNDVFYTAAAERYRTGDLAGLVATTNKNLAISAFPAALLFMVCAPDAFAIIFGEQWRQAGIFAQIMTPWLLFQFITTPSTAIYPIINRHGTVFFFQFSLLLSSIIAFIISKYYGNIYMFITIISFFNSIIYFSRLCHAYRISGAGLKSLMNSIGISLILGIIVIIPTIGGVFIDRYVGYEPVSSIIGFCISLMVLTIILIRNVRSAYRPENSRVSIG